jgi:translation elongation factor EF-Tu-like GTPase
MKRKMNLILTVEDIFFIKSKGTVITGWIDGEIDAKVGDQVKIIKPGEDSVISQILGIEKFRSCWSEESSKRNYGILLKDVSKEEIPQNSKVYLIES